MKNSWTSESFISGFRKTQYPQGNLFQDPSSHAETKICMLKALSQPFGSPVLHNLQAPQLWVLKPWILNTTQNPQLLEYAVAELVDTRGADCMGIIQFY